MNDSKKLLMMLLIGLVLGVAVVLVLQGISKEKDLDSQSPQTEQKDQSKPKTENVDYIIYIDSEASEKEINDVQEKIKSLDLDISNMTFKNKEQVKKEMLESMDEEEASKSVLNTYTPENNPLDHMLLLSVKNVENKDDLKQKIMILVNVTDVKY